MLAMIVSEFAPWIIGAIGVLIGLMGLKSRSNAKQELSKTEARIDAIKTAREIGNEVSEKSDSDLSDVASQWVRNNKR